ncbi:DsbA family oxidoreductase [Paenibacillus chartarius]|uniref:DsbA family oxidoreductase n=1 Tax=Paenibacillus chartarius TaxID=747481 RepID=A0ABV6DVB0_9BACL
MKVEVWSDFACPFCYIGKRRFEAALEQFPQRAEVEIVYRSFELDPNAPRKVEYDVHQMLANKYGMPRERAVEMNRNMTEQAADVGLTYNMDTIAVTNTFDAHRLTHYAAAYSKRNAMTERLLKAYFTDSLNLSDHETLAGLAAEIGLDRDEVLRMLAEGEYGSEVRADEQEAAQLGIRGVPFFVIDRKFGVSGAQPSEVFVQALQQAWEESRPLTMLNEQGGELADEACADGVCTPPAKK